MTTFLELTAELAREPAAKAAYQADPEAFLAARGWGGLDSADLAEALSHSVEALPAPAAAGLPSSQDLATGQVAPSDALAQVASAAPFDGDGGGTPLVVADLPHDATDEVDAGPTPTADGPAGDSTIDDGSPAPVEEPEVEAGLPDAEVAAGDAPGDGAHDLEEPAGEDVDPFADEDGLTAWEVSLDQPEGLADLVEVDGAHPTPAPEAEDLDLE